MVDSNNATHTVQDLNVYLSEELEYYRAAEPEKLGDSRIPFPTPGLVACISMSPQKRVRLEDIDTILQSFGNRAPETYPGYESFITSEGNVPTEVLTGAATSTAVSDEATSAETAAKTNAGLAAVEEAQFAASELPVSETPVTSSTPDVQDHPQVSAT